MSIGSTSTAARTLLAVPDTATAVRGAPRRLGIPWLTVVLLAVLLAVSTAFWVESLQGAVGFIGRSQHPSATWRRDAALLFPLFVLSVLGVWTIARRRYRDLNAAGAVVKTGLALTVVATVVGVATLIANSAYDYHLQSGQLRLAEAQHSTAVTGGTSHGDHQATAADDPGCTGACLTQRRTLQTHIRGVEHTSGLLLATNLVTVSWVIALRGGRLGTAASRTPRGARKSLAGVNRQHRTSRRNPRATADGPG